MRAVINKRSHSFEDIENDHSFEDIENDIFSQCEKEF